MTTAISSAEIIWLGVSASLVAGLGTGVGALGVFFIRELSPRLEDGMLSAAAGVMLAASFFSLLLPGIEFGEALYATTLVAVSVVTLGVLAGAGTLYAIHRFVPHEHFVSGREGPEAEKLSRLWLFIIAITVHNFPEGMAVGVGFAGGDADRGTALAAGILVQNIPEGLAVAVALVAAGYSPGRSFFVAFLTGLVEAVGGFVGSAAVSLAEPLIPWTLGFAAGAMLFVISDEIIPETHRRGYENVATFSLLGGVIVMLYLNAMLG